MKPLRISCYFLTLFLLFQSCSKDPDVVEVVPDVTDPIPDCPQYVNEGTFEMADGSDGFLPYDDTMQRVIFSDAQGVEYSAEITHFSDGFSTNLYPSMPCPEDSTQTFNYQQMTETKAVVMEITDLNFKLSLSLRVITTRKEVYEDLNLPGLDTFLLYDALSIVLRNPPDQIFPNTQTGITVNPRNHPFAMLSIPTSMTNINGELFSEVYFGSSGSGTQPADFNLYYTKEQGLIGIVRKDATFSLKFERIE